jgi:hypothetical protein
MRSERDIDGSPASIGYEFSETLSTDSTVGVVVAGRRAAMG